MYCPNWISVVKTLSMLNPFHDFSTSGVTILFILYHGLPPPASLHLSLLERIHTFSLHHHLKNLELLPFLIVFLVCADLMELTSVVGGYLEVDMNLCWWIVKLLRPIYEPNILPSEEHWWSASSHTYPRYWIEIYSFTEMRQLNLDIVKIFGFFEWLLSV